MPPHKAYGVSYRMQLSENTIGISGYTSLTDLSPGGLEYRIFTAQVAFLCYVKLISDLELKEDAQESYLIKRYNNLTANEITEISNINFNVATGVTAGLIALRLRYNTFMG